MEFYNLILGKPYNTEEKPKNKPKREKKTNKKEKFDKKYLILKP
jgi:hypothetical protein